MVKSKSGKVNIALIAVLAFALVPLVTQAVIVGEDCIISNPSVIQGNCNAGLECLDSGAQKVCIPAVENRKIGSYCTQVVDCDTREGFLKLTCDTDRRYCVGASRGVSCEDTDVNASSTMGAVTSGTLAPVYRCGTSLFCDANGECARDLGAEFVEEMGVGE